MADSPDLVAAKRLLDAAKDAGFTFQWIAPGGDAPLLGVRQSTKWLDEIHLGGFWAPQSCTAIRRRRSSLVVPRGLPVAQRVSGSVLTVLHTVVTHWPA